MTRASDWRPHESGSLRGFFVLHLASGLVLRDCTFHRTATGAEWIGLPGKPQIDRDGQPRRDPQTGKLLYVAIVDVEHRARPRFQAEALAAVHELIGETVP